MPSAYSSARRSRLAFSNGELAAQPAAPASSVRSDAAVWAVSTAWALIAHPHISAPVAGFRQPLCGEGREQACIDLCIRASQREALGHRELTEFGSIFANSVLRAT